MAKKQKSPEGLQQEAVLSFLQVHSIEAFRMNTGVAVAEYTSKRTGVTKKRAIRYGTKGMADILALPWFDGETHPVPLWIEMKSATGKRTPQQVEFEARVTQGGCSYIVARSIDDVESWLRKRAKR